MSTFVKLHRKVLENPMWQNDIYAMHVFLTLLVLVDHKTGKWSGGRRQLARETGINHNTVYSALERLEAQQMVNRKANTSYTEYSICNWGTYQQSANKSVNHSSTTRQHSNKKLRSEEYNNIDKSILDKSQYGRTDINEMLEYFEEINGHKPSKGKLNRYAITRLLKKMKSTDLRRVIKAAKEAQDEDDYAPRVFNFLDLEQKLPNIADYYRRKENSSNKVIMIE